MIDTKSKVDPLTEFRYALDVMDEYSHLGLDDEYASKLRDILLRRIAKAEEALSSRSSHPIRFPVTTSTSG